MDATIRAEGDSDPGLSFPTFVALMAGLMAVNALAIDIMLPSLPAMGQSLSIEIENRRQWIIAVYILGFGLAQLFPGPLADHFGRKPVLVWSTALFAVFGLAAACVSSFSLMLVMRFLQGITASASRILVVSIVRDCYSGRQMARVMSLAMIVFLLVPLLAPAIGQLVVTVTGSWRFNFVLLGAFGLFLAVFSALRLNETLRPEMHRPMSLGAIARAMKIVIETRQTIGYILGSAAVYGSVMGFVTSVQQIFADVLRAPDIFPLVFALIAGGMACAAFLNAQIVVKLGMRRVSHTAMFLFATCAFAHLLVALSGHETVVTFAVLQALTMFSAGLMGSNFGAMSMEPMGGLAGTASSVQGFLSTCIGGVIGIAIGQSFDRSTVPFATGLTLIGLGIIAVVLVTEKGRLFKPHHQP